MPYSNNQLGSIVLHCELHLFYDTPIVCGYSKGKVLKVNPNLLFVHAIHSLPYGEESLINDNFRRPPTTCQKGLALGLPSNIHLRGKKNMIESLYF